MNAVAKNRRLIQLLSEGGAWVIAYSGGVDSTFLLAMALSLPRVQTLAVMAESPIHPVREKPSALAVARGLGVDPVIITSREMSDARFLRNDPNRCYLCKRMLFADIRAVADRHGIQRVAHGANRDDLDDFRPGHAAAREMGIDAPLADVGLSKAEIRQLSRDMGLPTWDKPAMACLATRIPYGTPLDEVSIRRIDAAEAILQDLGFTGCRVRLHGDVARIELDPAQMGRAMDDSVRSDLVKGLLGLGFCHVALDLEGYRSGSMNRPLSAGNKVRI